jgi:hypothetical protein
MKYRGEAHMRLKNEILLALGSRRDLKVWNNPTGAFLSIATHNVVRCGQKGQPDILGVIGPRGRLLCIELKTGAAVLDDDQKAWRSMAEGLGALYIEARTVKDVIDAFNGEVKK